MPDNYSMWKKHQDSQDAWLARRPVCSECGEHIQEESAFRINDELICESCMVIYRVNVEDYI